MKDYIVPIRVGRLIVGNFTLLLLQPGSGSFRDALWLALMIATAIDAVTDPVMGTVSDNLRSSFGRRHTFMYASSLPLAVSFYFLFDPVVGDESGLFIWLTCFSIMTRMSMTLFHVPP